MNFKLNNYRNLSVTQILIGINVAIFVVMYIFNFKVDFLNKFSSVNVLSFGYEGINGSYIHKEFVSIFSTNQYYRFLTANYLHGSPMHIIFNMLALYSLGQVIEPMIGRLKFFIVYTISGLGGTLLSSVMNLYLNPNDVISSVGASGAVFGIAGCLVVLAIYRSNKGMDFLYRINYKPLVVMLGMNLIIAEIINRTGGGNLRIDNWGHIGGLIAGCLIGLIYTQMKNRY